MKKMMKNDVFRPIQIRPLSTGGPMSQPNGASQPPKNSTGISTDISSMPMYSPTKNRPNFMPEYSVLKPEMISDSPSARSKGQRFVSASAATMNTMQPKNCGMMNHWSSCASTIVRMLKLSLRITMPSIEMPMNTS